MRIVGDAKFIDPGRAATGDGSRHGLAVDVDFDIAICFGRGRYLGRRVDKLFDVVATPL